MALVELGLPGDRKCLSELRKSERGNIQAATLLRELTTVKNEWIAKRLAMVHLRLVRRVVVSCHKDESQILAIRKLKKY